MALTVGDRDVRPLTVDDVERMVHAGILAEDEPAELLHGVLVERGVKSPAHATVHSRLAGWLFSGADAGGFIVRSEHPLMVPDPTSLPAPDLAVVEPGAYERRHPTSALLVIEVACSTLRTDTRVKPRLFAAAGVPEMWVVDVAARQVRVFREPGVDGYATERVLGEGEAIEPAHVAAPPLGLAELFAGL